MNLGQISDKDFRLFVLQQNNFIINLFRHQLQTLSSIIRYRLSKGKKEQISDKIISSFTSGTGRFSSFLRSGLVKFKQVFFSHSFTDQTVHEC